MLALVNNIVDNQQYLLAYSKPFIHPSQPDCTNKK